MLYSFIAIGSIWFWLLMLIAIIVGVSLLENEAVATLASFTFGFALITALLIPIKPLLLWIVANPLLILSGVGVYFILGVLYSFLKYDNLNGRIERRYEEVRTKWLINTNAKEINGTNKVAWSLYIRDFTGGYKIDGKLSDYAFNRMSYLDYKALIVAWIVWWPLSLTWLIINDPLRKMAEWFVFRFRAVYTWIANRHRKSVKNDVETDEHALFQAKQISRR